MSQIKQYFSSDPMIQKDLRSSIDWRFVSVDDVREILDNGLTHGNHDTAVDLLTEIDFYVLVDSLGITLGNYTLHRHVFKRDTDTKLNLEIKLDILIAAIARNTTIGFSTGDVIRVIYYLKNINSRLVKMAVIDAYVILLERKPSIEDCILGMLEDFDSDTDEYIRTYAKEALLEIGSH